MKYGICTNHNFKTSIGSIYMLDDSDDEYYIVKEGNCDAIKKDSITLMSKDEYNFIRKVQDEILSNISIFSEDTKEYIINLYNKKNIYKKL